jgi:hypothetical protein
MPRFSHPAIKYELDYDLNSGRATRYRQGMAEEAAPADIAVALLYQDVQALKASLGVATPTGNSELEQRISTLENRIGAVEVLLNQMVGSFADALKKESDESTPAKKTRKSN